MGVSHCGAHLMEPVVVLGRERVLEEIELELLAILDELDGLAGLIALVHVVHQLDFEAKILAAGGEDIEHAAQGGAAVEHRTFMQPPGGGCPSGPSTARRFRRRSAAATAAASAGAHTNVFIAARHGLTHVFDHVFGLGASGIGEHLRGFAALAAPQIVDRHSSLPALDVPQRLIHAADGVVEHRAVAPVGAVVAHLPRVLDTVGRFADEQRLQVSFDRQVDEVSALRESGAAVAEQAVLIGHDFDDAQASPGRLRGNHAHVFDPGRGHAPYGSCRFLLRQQLAAARESGRRAPGDHPQNTASVHNVSPIPGVPQAAGTVADLRNRET